MSDGREWVEAAVVLWAASAGAVWAFVRGAHRRRRKPSEPLPPGYGEHYHYRSYFDEPLYRQTGVDAAGMPEVEPIDDLLAPMPEDQWGDSEPTNVIEAYHRFSACKVCGYKSRICSSEACPQRRFLR